MNGPGRGKIGVVNRHIGIGLIVVDDDSRHPGIVGDELILFPAAVIVGGAPAFNELEPGMKVGFSRYAELLNDVRFAEAVWRIE